MNWTIEQGCKIHPRVKSIMKIILRPYENNLFKGSLHSSSDIVHCSFLEQQCC